MLAVNDAEIPLGTTPNEPVSVVVDPDIKLPPRTGVGKLGNGILQISPVKKI